MLENALATPEQGILETQNMLFLDGERRQTEKGFPGKAAAFVRHGQGRVSILAQW